MRGSIAALALVLAGCATPRLLPAPSIVVRAPEVAPNIVGEWTAAAINGVPADAADRFALTITPTTLEASLCNRLSGDYRLEGSRLVRTGAWGNTERGCYDPSGKRDPMASEARVFAILYSALSVTTPTPDSMRFTSARGTIDFVRGSPLSHAIIGEWTASALDGRPAAAADRFPLTIAPIWLRASLCNDVYGAYRVLDRRIVSLGPPWPRTERGCSLPRQRLDDRAWAVLGGLPTITMLDPARMRLTSARGSIDFERRR
ncbi:MAG: META domain-containing protein [Sphingomonas bacterium]|nr:META domain-containing protein [Sphingomonas bacterium]